MAAVTTFCPYNFSDPQSVLDVARTLPMKHGLIDSPALHYLVGNCTTVCDTALGNGNPDLAGVGVSSSVFDFNFHKKINTRMNLGILIFLIGFC